MTNETNKVVPLKQTQSSNGLSENALKFIEALKEDPNYKGEIFIATSESAIIEKINPSIIFSYIVEWLSKEIATKASQEVMSNLANINNMVTAATSNKKED